MADMRHMRQRTTGWLTHPRTHNTAPKEETESARTSWHAPERGETADSTWTGVGPHGTALTTAPTLDGAVEGHTRPGAHAWAGEGGRGPGAVRSVVI